MTRKPRVSKKLHKHWLELAVVDLSQVKYWRERLFKSEFDQELPIDASHCEGLWQPAVNALEKYELEYTVRKIMVTQVSDSWLLDDGLVVFEFRAKNFPAVRLQTGNNPNVI